MSRFITLLLSVFVVSNSFVFAQKVKTEGLGYYNYIHPRSNTELDNLSRYFIHVETHDGESYRRELIERELNLDTYQRVQDRNVAEFMIHIEEAEFKFGPSKKKSISGGENGATTYYYAGTIDYHYLIKVLNTSGEEITRKIVKGSVKTSGRSSTSVTDAHRNYKSDKNKFKENCAKEAANKLGKWFKDAFLDQEKTLHLRATTIKSKKFDYPGFQNAFTDLTLIYDAINSGESLSDEIKTKRDNCITFWTEFVKDKTPEDKKSRINADVTAAAYYNLGLVYFFDRQFKMANTYFQEAMLYNKNVVAGLMNLNYVSADCVEREANH